MMMSSNVTMARAFQAMPDAMVPPIAVTVWTKEIVVSCVFHVWTNPFTQNVKHKNRKKLEENKNRKESYISF